MKSAIIYLSLVLTIVSTTWAVLIQKELEEAREDYRRERQRAIDWRQEYDNCYKLNRVLINTQSVLRKQ